MRLHHARRLATGLVEEVAGPVTDRLWRLIGDLLVQVARPIVWWVHR